MSASTPVTLPNHIVNNPLHQDIEISLRRFVENPRALREKLRDVDGIITGGFALQFLAGVEWPESDLDICVNKNGAQHLADHLVHFEGYDLVSRVGGKYGWTEVVEVQTYDKEVATASASSSRATKVIQVIFTNHEPIKSQLCECYTTALLNAITYDAVYSLFPIPTFRDKVTFSLKQPDDFHNLLLRKYRARGYRDVQRLPTPAESDAAGGCFLPTTRRRRVGDEFTWKVVLPTAGIDPPLVASGIEQVCFDMCENRLPFYDEEWMVLGPIT